MVTQADAPSTSSSIGKGNRFYESLLRREKAKFERFFMSQAEGRLLLELANLHDGGVLRFLEGPYLANRPMGVWKSLWSRETESSILEARNELRELWETNRSATRKEEILSGWLRQGAAHFLLVRWRGRTFDLFPNYSSLRAFLFIGILHRSAHFARCHNPSCPAPYFLAKRRSQKFCERGDCTAHAQRKYALKWWNAEGRKRRRGKGKSQRSGTRRR